MAAHMSGLHAHVNTSKPFNKFLAASGFERALSDAGLERKMGHTIVPPVRAFGSIDACYKLITFLAFVSTN